MSGAAHAAARARPRQPSASLRTLLADREPVVARLPLLLGGIGLVVFAAWYWQPAYRYDEFLVAVERTQRSWQSLLHVISTRDPAPAFLYLAMKPWTALSTDPWWTRIPSVLAMTVAVAGLVELVRRVADPPTAVAAGLLMIIVPGTSRWAQDNRMYAAATAFVVLAVLAWWRWLETGRRSWSVAYCASVVLMGLFHLYTLTMVPVLLFAAWWIPADRRRTLARTIVPVAIAGVFLLPLVWLNIRHPTGAPTNPPLSLLSIATIGGANFGVLTAVPVGLLAILGAGWGWRRARWRPAVALGVAWVVIPLAGFVVARVVLGIPTLVARYDVFAIPGACLMAGIGVTAIRERHRDAAVVVMVALAVLALPAQVGIRALEGHSSQSVILGRLLASPELAPLPVTAATASSRATVGTATYPERRLVADAAPTAPVAIVVGRVLPFAPSRTNPYLVAGTEWRPVVTCEFENFVVMEIVAVPGATLPGGTPDALADRLNALAATRSCAANP